MLDRRHDGPWWFVDPAEGLRGQRFGLWRRCVHAAIVHVREHRQFLAFARGKRSADRTDNATLRGAIT